MVIVWLDLRPGIGFWAFWALRLLSSALKQQYGDNVNGYQMISEQIGYLASNTLMEHAFRDRSHITRRTAEAALQELYSNPWL